MFEQCFFLHKKIRPGPRRNTSHLSSFQENTRKKIRGIGSTHVRLEGASKCSNN
jgi:hypothetical protein